MDTKDTKNTKTQKTGGAGGNTKKDDGRKAFGRYEYSIAADSQDEIQNGVHK